MPDLTTQQMVEVDRAMIEDYRIELVQMMENAGRNLAHLARTRFLDGDPRRRSVVALAGGGGNGGGGAGRRPATIELGCRNHRRARSGSERDDAGSGPSARYPAPDGRAHVADGMPQAARPPAVVLDGLIGYSLTGAPFGTIAELIR